MTRIIIYMTNTMITGILLAAIARNYDDGKREVTAKEVVMEDFSYRLVKVDKNGDKYKFVLTGVPPFVHSLDMAPAAREDKLNRGTWLVLATGIFSQTDLNCIGMAVQNVKSYSGTIRLGIRPFWMYEENMTCFPEYKDETRSPLWIIIMDRTVKGWHAGFMSNDELREFIQKSLR